jgi:hypothetical protein
MQNIAQFGDRPIPQMRSLRWSIAVLGLTIIFSGDERAMAQALKDQTPVQQAPRTKLEAFAGETGAVIIKGYTEVGTVRSIGSISVSAVTFRNARLGQESKGISISITELEISTRTSHAFIDYDEIDELVSGIDYISKADTTLTRLANYEATYSTKGGFKTSVFNSVTGQNQVNVSTGSFGNGIPMKMPDLARLREIIQSAKNILDNPNSVAARGARPSSPTAETTIATTPSVPAEAAPPGIRPAAAKPKPKPAVAVPLH